MTELNRRSFLAAAAVAGCACALDCPFAVAADAPQETTPVDIGPAADFPKDGPYDNQGVPKPKTKDGDETPAKKPLVRFAITRNSDGHLIVDRSKTFDKAQWNDPASFVKLEGRA